ncbi:MAG: tetratricopeptide repeat protein, partial [Planctomycetota bacterium]
MFAGRLAGRLGGSKLRRWLCRRAVAVAPDHPGVRCFARHFTRRRNSSFDFLRSFEDSPELETDDADLQVSWLGMCAQLWGSFRCFEVAHGLVEQAKAICADDAWAWVSESRVLLAEDRWAEALDAAERAAGMQPSTPHTVDVVCTSLAKLGRFEEAAEHARKVAKEGQSYEVVSVAVWYLLAASERVRDEARRSRAREAYDLSGQLEPLAPLADRDTKSAIARIRSDAAFVLGDRALLTEHAHRVRSRFFREVARNLERSSGGRSVEVQARPVLQKHNTCLPASVASVLGAFGIDIDHDKLVEAITYRGTASWRTAKWVRDQGLLVRHFTATPELARSLLDRHIPFVMCFQGDLASHAVAVTGIDAASGTLVVHDPSCDRQMRMLLDSFHENEAPFGPEAALFVPRAKAAALDLIPKENYETAGGVVDFWHSLETKGATAAGDVVGALGRDYAKNPLVRRLEAVWLTTSGNARDALPIQEELLAKFPDSVALRNDVLNTLSRLGNSAKSLQHLKAVAERGLVSSSTEGTKWLHPPASVLCRYADFLKMSASTMPEAESLLRRALERYPFEASLYHVLGDALWFGGREGESTLPYRLASSLDQHDDHYARATADSLRRNGHQDEALASLGRRARALGDLVDGGGALAAWVDALENYGDVQGAMRRMTEAEEKRPGDAHVSAHAAQFWARHGEWPRADRALERLQSSENRPVFLAAASRYFDARGEWRTALENCRQWVSECPDSSDARELLLRLVEVEGGREAVRELCSQWLSDRPDNDDLEHVANGVFQRFFDNERREELLRRRTRRNREDGWAWRELGHFLAGKAETLAGAPREKALAELEDIVSECTRTGPHEAATTSLRGRIAECRGDLRDAAARYLEALTVDPEYEYCYDRCWGCAASWPEEDSLRLRAELEARMRGCVGHLHPARQMALRIAGRFGCAEAEAAIGRWSDLSPKDPELAEAHADVLLAYGRGRTDAERARAVLEGALALFPHHVDLRMSLAHALDVLESSDEEIAVLEELMARSPTHGGARVHLSNAYRKRGKHEDALRLLDEGIRIDPVDGYLRKRKVDLLLEVDRYHDAGTTFSAAVERLPEHVRLREDFIGFLMKHGEHEKAIEAARKGVDVFPDGAFCWCLLARALRMSGKGSTHEAETTYRKALELNRALFDAADELAILLAEQRRFDEAESVIAEQMPLLTDTSLSRGRLAWIERESGKKPRAVQSMRRILQDFPLYKWGWDRLLDWLEEDGSMADARGLLEDAPAPLLQDPEFAGRRLLLLGKAGPGDAKYDEEWKQLLVD